MSTDTIKAAIPHREPFLLVDEIIEQSETHIACRKRFTGDEFWYRGHFPDFHLTPGVILCEAAMQAGAILLAQHTTDRGENIPVVTRMNDVRFRRMVRPGDTIEIDVTLRERLADAFFLDAHVTCSGKTAVRFSFACTMVHTESQSV